MKRQNKKTYLHEIKGRSGINIKTIGLVLYIGNMSMLHESNIYTTSFPISMKQRRNAKGKPI